MVKKKSKKMSCKKKTVFGILFLLAIGIVAFVGIQAVYYDYNAPSSYTLIKTEWVSLYNGNEVTLSPPSGEAWEFLEILMSDGTRLEQGLVIDGSYNVGCWWGDSSDWEVDCKVEVKMFHAPVYASEGQSCSEEWETCKTGYPLECISGICRDTTPEPECSYDSDCADGGYTGLAFCSSGDVYKNLNEGDCVSGTCTFKLVSEKIQSCSDSCSGGVCIADTPDNPVLPEDPTVPADSTVMCALNSIRATGEFVVDGCGDSVEVREVCINEVWRTIEISDTCVRDEDGNKVLPSAIEVEEDILIIDWVVVLSVIGGILVLVGAFYYRNKKK